MIFLDSIFVFLIGLEFGSFANVCVYRWPRSLSILSPTRSFCPWCKIKISWYDNIPVVSYFNLKRRCRHCLSLISFRYPFVELVMGLLWLGTYFAIRPTTQNLSWMFLLIVWCFIFILIVTTFTDFDWRIIPNEASYFLVIVGLIASPLNPLLSADGSMPRVGESILGLVTGGGLLFSLAFLGKLIFKKEAMGGGDIKLAAGIGTILGWKAILLTLMLASVFGGMVSIGGLLIGSLKRNQYIPFGPFINLGAFISIIVKWFFPKSLDLFLKI
ncbi:hypothetical protein BVX98_03215 [bacterium F11]|nr:hypothetical protein BVX98_03215 [bacterium F11]